MTIEENIDLKAYNTFGLSTVARRLVRAQSRDHIQQYFEEYKRFPELVLGGGSNILLSRDIDGDVLKVEVPGVEVVGETDAHYLVKVGAGVEWHAFVLTAIENGWAGVENLSLIPGNVGAAPMQNIGAYGVEIKDVFHQLEAYLTDDHCFEHFNLKDCRFGYRESIFKHELKNKAVITSVTFKLNKTPQFNTSYGAIESMLESMGVEELSLAAVSKAVIEIRQSKLPDPKVLGNAGSFFKNPVIPTSQFLILKESFPSMVGYQLNDDETKVAAGWLIEDAGFKGQRFGNCGVHERQALVLVNLGNASGEEVLGLSQLIIDAVKSRYGIQLEREVNLI